MILSPSERRALRRAIKLTGLRKGPLVTAVLLGSLGLGASVALTAVAAWLIAKASQLPPVLSLSVAAVAVRTFGISRSLFRYLERLVSHDVALEGMATLRQSVYQQLAASRTERVAGLKRGDLLVRTGSDVDAIGDVVIRALLPILTALVVGTATTGFMIWLYPPAGLILGACLLVAGIGVPWLTGRAAKAAEIAQAKERAELSAAALTMVDGGSELSVWGRLPVLRAQLASQEAELERLRDRVALPAALGSGLDTAAMAAATLGALITGIPATANGLLSPLSLAVIVLTPIAAFEATATLGEAASQLVRSAAAATRVMELLDSAGEKEERSCTLQGATAQLDVAGAAAAWPDGPLVTRPATLQLMPGRAVVILGKSGVGKSTLLATLAGLLAPRQGSVKLHGSVTELCAAPRDAVARYLTLTAEDAHVFATSVHENLRVANPDLTAERAEELLHRVGLGEWLSGLPDGVATQLGSDAATVSGGERRRLLVARALASPAPLLLIDEPAEHLDEDAAAEIQRDLLELAHGTEERGIVLVTHHLGGIEAADEVYTLTPGAEAATLVKGRGDV